MSRLTFAAAAAALLCQRLAADHAREAMRGARRAYHPVEIAIGRVLSLPLMVMPEDLAWPDPLRFGWHLERR